jgi:hypothetical protein
MAILGLVYGIVLGLIGSGLAIGLRSWSGLPFVLPAPAISPRATPIPTSTPGARALPAFSTPGLPAAEWLG